MHCKDHAYWVGLASTCFLGIATLYFIISSIVHVGLFSDFLTIYWAIAVLFAIFIPVISLMTWRSRRWSYKLVKLLGCLFWTVLSIYEQGNEVPDLFVNLVFAGLALSYLGLLIGSFSKYELVEI